jgi:predicted AAA+ superfamily ATPase
LQKNFIMDDLFIRNTYLKKVEPYIGKEIIKVLTGQRRVGKTILLKQIERLVQQLDKKANTIYVNKEQHEFKQIKNAEDLFEYVESKLKAKQSNYVFIDEIQEIREFPPLLVL